MLNSLRVVFPAACCGTGVRRLAPGFIPLIELSNRDINAEGIGIETDLDLYYSNNSKMDQ